MKVTKLPYGILIEDMPYGRVLPMDPWISAGTDDPVWDAWEGKEMKQTRDDLIVGSWRNGLSAKTRGTIEGCENLHRAGFNLQPEEAAIVAMAQLLDSYDTIAEEFIMTEPVVTLGTTEELDN